MEKIKGLIGKVLTREVFFYIIFGLFTTAVNLSSFYVMNTILKWNENVSNILAIILAVLCAYLTNKDLVFHSNAKTKKDKLIQFVKFMLGRAFTTTVEFLGGLVLFNLPIPNIIVKTIITVIAIILNFFISKYFAFKRD